MVSLKLINGCHHQKIAILVDTNIQILLKI